LTKGLGKFGLKAAEMTNRYTLGQLTEESWARHDDYESMFFEGTWHRSHQLAGRARRLTGGFIELGVLPGDRVVVLMANCPEVGVTYAALWRAGAVVTPVVFLVSEEELRHVLADSGAKVVVTTPDWIGKVEAAGSGLGITAVVAGEIPPAGENAGGAAGAGQPAAGPAGSQPSRRVALSDLERAAETAVVDRKPDDLAAVMYTGGTTGRAKGVMLTNEGLWRVGKASYDQAHIPGINRVLVPLPLSHSYGLIVTLVGMHSEEKGVSVLQRWFDAKQWLSLVAEHSVQQSTVVPAMLQLLLAEPALDEAKLPELRYLTSGAAPLPGEVRDEIERRIPGVQILEGYGLTETCAVTAVNPPGRRRDGSVGLPLPCYQVVIRDDNGTELASGQDGEVCVRGDSLMRAYWKAPEATEAALSESGGVRELRTGDIGRLDEDGYLYIVDRKKDLIIRNGFNVYPRDVEDALVEHPDVHMAGVVGRPDPKVGEEIVAFVMPRWGATGKVSELAAFARERLAGNKYPREIRVVDMLPMTSVGKLDRKKLREMVLKDERPGGE
jgi:long-chain acyl-CoA synthetase